jgi:hypothetical protein
MYGLLMTTMMQEEEEGREEATYVKMGLKVPAMLPRGTSVLKLTTLRL